MYFQPSGSGSAVSGAPANQRFYNIYNPSEDDIETEDDEYVHLEVLSSTPLLFAKLNVKVPAGTPAGLYALSTQTDTFASGLAWRGQNLAVTQATTMIQVTPEPMTALLLLGALPLLRRRRA